MYADKARDTMLDWLKVRETKTGPVVRVQGTLPGDHAGIYWTAGANSTRNEVEVLTVVEEEMKRAIERRCDYEESLKPEGHKLTADDKKQLDNSERGKAAAFDLDLALDDLGPMVSKAFLDRIRSIIDEIGVDPEVIGSHY